MDKIKYNIDQKVFVISSEPYHDTCDICKGKGKIKLKNRTYICPECNGSGKMYIENKKWYIFEGIIKNISINESNSISYTVCSKSTGLYYGSIDEDNIFINKKLALANCKKRKRLKK